MSAWRRFADWLHLQWPAGTVEKLPEVRDDGSTNVPGLFVAGDLRGVPLLKFSADTGARVAERIADDLSRNGPSSADADVFDLAIVGAGVAGMSAALTARRRGLRFVVLESSEPFSTIVNFPRAKPIYTYPKDMTPAGELAVTASVKEALVDELRRQTVDQGIVPVTARVERIAKAAHGFDVVLAGGDTVRARRVLAALGRSGDFRRLDVPGEDLDKVSNRLHDPRDFEARRVLVVGGGDSALESAIALAENGADVTLSYRRAELARPKAENVERVNELSANGTLALRLATEVTEIRGQDVVLRHADGRDESIPNDFVFAMIGREAPLEFFRRSGVTIAGDRGAKFWATLLAFAGVIGFLYHWKAGGKLTAKFQAHGWFPFQFVRPEDASSLAGTLGIAFQTPAAWFTLAYTLAIVGFGIRRIRRRRTPYVTVQTLTLMAFQIVPLFLLPSVLLPWAGHRGAFGDADRVVTITPAAATRWEENVVRAPGDSAALLQAVRPDLPADVAGWPDLSLEVSWPIRHAGDRLLLHGADGRLATVRVSDRRIHVHDPTRGSSWWADQLFPASEWDAQGREYWRTIGLILAWPLFLWNVFTYQPMVLWLVISVVQTFVLIPLLIRFWGKGAYCGWICSCGGLAETMGDEQRHKMPHGPGWNRLNLAGQVVLGIAFVLLGLRVAGWVLPWDHPVNALFKGALEGKALSGASLPFPFGLLNYKWFIDLFLAGVLGTGLYFHFSGRVWCRFFCPLAALMHVYARFSRFRILADKKKCISCNVCTSVCHQGIDVMSFANKGRPMADPECVRCSACVQSCPTGVLSFGQVDRNGKVVAVDGLVASAVRAREGTA